MREAQPKRAAFGPQSRGVPQEVCQRPLQAAAVGAREDGLSGQIEGKLLIAAAKCRADGSRGLACYVAEIALFESQLERVGLEPSQLTEIPNQFVQPISRYVDVSQQAMNRLRGARRLVTQHDADRRLDRRQRCAEIVSEASEKRVLDGIVVGVSGFDR